MANYTVFYGTQVVGEYHKPQDMRNDIPVESDLYQGGYYYWKNDSKVFDTCGWYRMDHTPVLLEDVPKQLRTMVLLLNL